MKIQNYFKSVLMLYYNYVLCSTVKNAYLLNLIFSIYTYHHGIP